MASRARATFKASKGRTKTIEQGRTLYTRAVSARLEAMFKEASEPIAVKSAELHRAEVSAITQGYFTAMLKGAKDLVENSTVKVNYDGADVNVEVGTLNKTRKRNPRSRTFSRGTTSGVIHHQGAIRYPKIVNNVQHEYSTNIRYRWENMSLKYAKSTPRSKRFYYKRYDDNPKSSRVFFKNKIDELIKRSSTSSAYNKGKLSTQYNPKTGVLKSSFTINFPNLGTQWDFLRRSFLSGENSRIELVTDNRTATGIARAEAKRPMIRPFASSMGFLWRRAVANDVAETRGDTVARKRTHTRRQATQTDSVMNAFNQAMAGLRKGPTRKR